MEHYVGTESEYKRGLYKTAVLVATGEYVGLLAYSRGRYLIQKRDGLVALASIDALTRFVL